MKIYIKPTYIIWLGILLNSYSSVAQTNKSKALINVKTDAGMVSGVRNASGDIAAFKGVPFAAPPVGDLRWKAPQPAKHWDSVKKCDAFGPSPAQAKPTPFMVYTSEFLIPKQPISEDCLYLNIWTNAKTKADKKAVLVWIYGGGFSSGGSAVPIYDGEALAKKGIIFVSINYRVGAFGFLAYPGLSKESGNGSSGNYGLMDQIAALKWVKHNIAAFGGDPNNVTIAGQSAGSMSVSCLVASPLAKGLFNRAIAESGSLLVSNPLIGMKTLSAAEEKSKQAAEKRGITSLSEMRKLSTEEVMNIFQGPNAPIADGYVLPESVSAIFANNQQTHLPLITGWNGDEAFVPFISKRDEYIKQAEKTYGTDADTFLKYFPGETDEQAARSQIEVSRDQTFALSGYKWASIQSSYSNSPVYVYNFDRKVPAVADMRRYGAFHTGEVAYVMNNLKFLNNRPFEPLDNKLAAQMSDYWVNFVKTGNPNGQGLANWPQYDIKKHLIKVFDAETKTATMPNLQGLDFLLSKSGK